MQSCPRQVEPENVVPRVVLPSTSFSPLSCCRSLAASGNANVKDATPEKSGWTVHVSSSHGTERREKLVDSGNALRTMGRQCRVSHVSMKEETSGSRRLQTGSDPVGKSSAVMSENTRGPHSSPAVCHSSALRDAGKHTQRGAEQSRNTALRTPFTPPTRSWRIP